MARTVAGRRWLDAGHAAAAGPSACLSAAGPPQFQGKRGDSHTSDGESLKGSVADDNSVITKMACQASTVKEVVSGTYTVDCTATYSDSSVWNGIASILTGNDNVEWQPTSMVSAGSSG